MKHTCPETLIGPRLNFEKQADAPHISEESGDLIETAFSVDYLASLPIQISKHQTENALQEVNSPHLSASFNQPIFQSIDLNI